MSLKSIFFAVSIFLLTMTCAHALSAEECKTRALNAYDNAAAVGGTDADKQRLGAYALNECLKEAGVSGGKGSNTNEGSSSLWGLIGLLLVGGIGWLFFAMAKGDLNASAKADEFRAKQFVEEIKNDAAMRVLEEATERNAHLFTSNGKTVLAEANRGTGSAAAKFNAMSGKHIDMTIDDITMHLALQSTRTTLRFLREHNITCIDFDGVSVKLDEQVAASPKRKPRTRKKVEE